MSARALGGSWSGSLNTRRALGLTGNSRCVPRPLENGLPERGM